MAARKWRSILRRPVRVTVTQTVVTSSANNFSINWRVYCCCVCCVWLVHVATQHKRKSTRINTPLYSFIAWRPKRDASRCAGDTPLGRMADPTEAEIVVGPDASEAQRPRRTRTLSTRLSTRAQENLEAQENALEEAQERRNGQQPMPREPP
jgi:hypothetical protein